MARKPLIAGNWKMNKMVGEGIALVKELMPRVQGLDAVGVAVCPSAVALKSVGDALAGSAPKTCSGLIRAPSRACSVRLCSRTSAVITLS